MRRLPLSSLTVVLCLLLTACAGPQDPSAPDAPTAPDGPVIPAEEPLRLDTLHVEFAVGERDTDALLQLQAEFPEALKAALAGQGVEVGSVSVTFGTSGEATETALQSGAVQLAFLSAEEYYPYRSGLVVASEPGEKPDLSLGLIICAASDDAETDERLAAALRGALPELADVLKDYTGAYAAGRYAFDTSALEQLSRLYDETARTH